MGPHTAAGPEALGRSARLALALLAVAPALATALLVARHAVNVPIWDDWERAKLLERWETGTLDFAYLYSPHIDHRILIPRLVALATAQLAPGNLRIEIGLNVVVIGAAALAVWVLLRRALPGRPCAALGTAFLANLLLFSPLQWENLLWAAQPWFLFPFAAFAWVLVALSSRLSLAAKWAASLLLALLATHTFSHGLAIWVLVPAYVFLCRWFATRAARARFLALWLLAAAAVLVPYFTVDGFRNTSESAHAFLLEPGERVPGVSLGHALAKPNRVALFLASVVGSPFARSPLVDARAVAPLAGGLLLAAFAAALGWWLSRLREPETWNRGLPFALLGGISLAACALAAVGRGAMIKWSYALLPHYLSISLWIPLATLCLAAIALSQLGGRAGPPGRARLARASAVAVGLFVGLQIIGWLAGWQGMREWESARLQARTSLLYLKHFEPHWIARLDRWPELVRRMSAILDRHGYLDPPLLDEPTLAPFAVAEQPLALEFAELEQVAAPGAELVLRGFAWLPHASRRADGVLVTHRAEGGERVVVAVAELHGLVEIAVPEHDYPFAGVRIPGAEDFASFSGRIELARLPQGVLELELFAVDGRRMLLHPLRDRIQVRRSGDGAEAKRVRGDS